MLNNQEIESLSWSLTQEAIEKYISHIGAELSDRWRNWKINLYLDYMHEVVGALLARQVTIASHFARSPECWNSHIAPFFLRAMIDVFINLSWILKDPDDRSKRFVLFGLGQQKLNLEHRKNQLSEDGIDPQPDATVTALGEWINSQRYEFLVEVDVGSWSGLDTRSMAIEANCIDLYNYAYTPFSAGVHSMWHHICRFNLTSCQNPLHKYHRVPIKYEISPDAGFLDLAAKYLSKSFAEFDKMTDFETNLEDGRWILSEALNKVAEELNIAAGDVE